MGGRRCFDHRWQEGDAQGSRHWQGVSSAASGRRSLTNLQPPDSLASSNCTGAKLSPGDPVQVGQKFCEVSFSQSRAVRSADLSLRSRSSPSCPPNCISTVPSSSKRRFNPSPRDRPPAKPRPNLSPPIRSCLPSPPLPSSPLLRSSSPDRSTILLLAASWARARLLRRGGAPMRRERS